MRLQGAFFIGGCSVKEVAKYGDRRMAGMTIRLSIRDESHAMALAQLCKRFLWEDCLKYADACDGKEREMAHANEISLAILDLENSLADAGFVPR